MDIIIATIFSEMKSVVLEQTLTWWVRARPVRDAQVKRSK